MTWKCALGIHRWSKWKPYAQHFQRAVPYTYDKFVAGVETRQSRTCQDCGSSQDEKIISGPSNLTGNNEPVKKP